MTFSNTQILRQINFADSESAKFVLLFRDEMYQIKKISDP